MAQEPELVYLFAGLLAISAVIILFLPALRRVALFSLSRLVTALIGVAILALAVGAVALVLLAVSNPVYSIPIVSITVVLRLASPTLLYRKVQDRFEIARGWASLRIFLMVGYFVLAVFLLYELILLAVAGGPPGPAVLSEQLIMAFGASSLIVRFAFRARPKDREGLLPVWLAAILFAVAFVVVAPYAFPEFAAAYLASGIGGWVLGALVIRRGV